MPVDPVPKESCALFVKGSHLWGRWFYPRKFATSLNYPLTDAVGQETNRRYEDVPEEQIERGDYELLSWDVQVL